MPDFQNQNILLGISGGIAAYKSANLVRLLAKLGAKVRVVMTKNATQFVTPLTFQALSGFEVRTDLCDPNAEGAMGHIELARWANVLLIAPASANILAKMAHGIADDLLPTLYLAAHGIPVVVCPAMNKHMWEHPATQANIAILQSRGVIILGPDAGSQACGDEGEGRMREPEHILEDLRLLSIAGLLQGKKVLITAGPTREAWDPVRFISNRSSGKMGYALARAARLAGAEVTLISGPSALIPPPGVHFIPVETALEMQAAAVQHLQTGMIVIASAAVSDYRPENAVDQKIKKENIENLTLQQNPDIVKTLVELDKAAYVVGFAAETQNLLKHAKDKKNKKGLQMIIANQVGIDCGFEVDAQAITIISDKTLTSVPIMHKTRIAAAIIQKIAEFLITEGTHHVTCRHQNIES
ncbi:MAG: bifunctional phosphopantothenoylcysteine decarboxylase/phosphopantothenate--cysteine ligase CoaBC [Legionellaceae bacterium]|nr:bifunctional phosphopantothenoylcysteine decarboxylase/phosphopantothenate--cysteine ligase CoaBC [Legionellaceae bacterium]